MLVYQYTFRGIRIISTKHEKLRPFDEGCYPSHSSLEISYIDHIKYFTLPYGFVACGKSCQETWRGMAVKSEFILDFKYMNINLKDYYSSYSIMRSFIH